MTDVYIYRFQLLVMIFILIFAFGVIFLIWNWFSSIKSSYKIMDGMPVIGFDQSGKQVLAKLKSLQNNRDFKENYPGVIFEENVYQEDELGNESIKYKKIFTLEKNILLKMNINKLLRNNNWNENEVVIHIATKLSHCRLEEV